MDDSDCSDSLSSLLCGEDESCFNEDDGFSSLNDSSALSDIEDEYISLLVQRECSLIKNHGCSDYCSMVEDWKKCARLQAIRWILKTRAFFDFDFQTAYLSITYLDRFLFRRVVDKDHVWAIQLLSVACLSLAAKMEESKVPLLSEYRLEYYSFRTEVIQRMELLVLNTLEWRMSCVTPLSYLDYFVNKFSNNSRPKSLLSKATELILGTAEVMNFMDHRPSVIAAVAVFTASGQTLTKESLQFKISSFTSCGSIENGVQYTISKHSRVAANRFCPSRQPLLEANINILRREQSNTYKLQQGQSVLDSAKITWCYRPIRKGNLTEEG